MSFKINRFGWIVSLVAAAALTGPLLALSEVELLRTPNGGIQPQAVADGDGAVHLVYFKGSPRQGDLFYVSRKAGSQEWSKPLRVNSQPGSARRNGAISHAQIALGREGRLHVVWFNMRPPKFFYSRLNDTGTAFEEQRDLVQKHNQGVESGASLAADGEGNVYVVWHAGDLSREDLRAVYMTQSSDDGKSFGPETRINRKSSGVCACCGLKALAAPDGQVLVSYRAAGERINRDMTLLQSSNRGRRFRAATLHPWSLSACPVSTTAMAASPLAGALAAWETKGQIYFANTADPSQVHAAPGAVSAPVRRKNPALAINEKGDTLLVWGEGSGWRSGGSLHWRIFDSKGNPTPLEGQSEEPIPDLSVATAIALPAGHFQVIY